MNADFGWPLVRRFALGMIAALLAATSSRAEVLSAATFDTDSYVFFGTNNVNSPEITLGAPTALGEDPHYNVAFIRFDVSSLSLSGNKFLEVEPNTTTGVLPAIVQMTALGADRAGFFSAGSAANRSSWIHTHAYGNPESATTYVSAAGGKSYADVTDIVNDWISNPASNYGFALWRVGGGGFDSPELYSMNDPGGRGPVLNGIPEPGSVGLCLTALIFGMGFIRLRRQWRSK